MAKRKKDRTSDIPTLIKGAVIGGLVYFLWGSISWMALGWHNSYLKTVPNEAALAPALRSQIPEAGLYYFPAHRPDLSHEQQLELKRTNPTGHMVVHPNGKDWSFPLTMGRALLFNILTVLLITWLLLHTKGLSFLRRTGFVLAVGLVGSLWMAFANWNWWAYPGLYLLVNAADLVVGWGLVGAVLAKFVVKD